MNLAEEFALLAYRDEGTSQIDGTRLDNGLAGALLLDLVLAGRIDVENKKVTVHDSTPLGDPLADRTLARIYGEPKERKPGHWVAKLAKDARSRTMDRLVEREVVRRERDKVLLVFPRTRYPATHGVEPPVETEVRQRLRAAVAGDGETDARTAALCALLAATDLDKKVFRDLDRKRVKARLKEIAGGTWAAEAVKRAIQSVEMATMAAATGGADGGGGDGGGGSS